jgi:hypothetical protein
VAKKKIFLWGIQIKPTVEVNDRGGTYFEFPLHIIRGSPANNLFFSNPMVRELIEKYSELKGEKIGTFVYSGGKRGKEYVLSETPAPFNCLGEAAFMDFTGKGIALELERKVFGELEKRLGKIRLVKKPPSGRNYKVRLVKKPVDNVRIRPSIGYASTGRERQVSARGIFVDLDKSYSATLRKMRSGIEKLRKQHRKRFRRG